MWAHSPEDATRLGLRRLSIKHRDNTITSVMDRKRKSKVIRSHTPTTIWPVPGILTVVHQWKVFSKDLHFQFLRRRCLFNAQPTPLKPWFHVQLLHAINYFRIWAGLSLSITVCDVTSKTVVRRRITVIISRCVRSDDFIGSI